MARIIILFIWLKLIGLINTDIIVEIHNMLLLDEQL